MFFFFPLFMLNPSSPPPQSSRPNSLSAAAPPSSHPSPPHSPFGDENEDPPTATDPRNPSPTEEDLPAKIHDLTHLLKFLLAQDYLCKTLCGHRYLPPGLHLQYPRWSHLDLHPPWRAILHSIRHGEQDPRRPHPPRHCDAYLTEPANAMGIDPDAILQRLTAVPLAQRSKLFSLPAHYLQGGCLDAATHRLDIDARWLRACFRTAEQRDSKLYTALVKAHAAQTIKIDRARGADARDARGGDVGVRFGLGDASAALERESFSSEVTLLGQKAGLGGGDGMAVGGG